MLAGLIWIGQRGRFCLIVGLAVGLLAPGWAEFLRPWVGTMIAGLLFVTGIRVGARRAFGNLDELRPTLVRLGVLQAALPVTVAVLLIGFGVADLPIAMAVTLMLAAPSVTGAPNFAIMIGEDPAPGMRLLVMGTMLFPLTALPVLMILDPLGGGALGAVPLALELLAAIILAVGLGFAIRRFCPGLGQADAQGALDGCAAILLSVVVVGLMSAIGPLLQEDPLRLVRWLLAAVSIHLGLVLLTYFVSVRTKLTMALSTAIYAGNRNIALFLIVLPDAVAAPLMIFVGCYQIPMYFTPILLSQLRKYHSPR